MSKPSVAQPSQPAKEIPLVDVSICFGARDYCQIEPDSVAVAGKDVVRILRYAYGLSPNNPGGFVEENVSGLATEVRGVADMLRALSDLGDDGHSVIDLEKVLFTLSEQLHHLAARLDAQTDTNVTATIQLPDALADGSEFVLGLAPAARAAVLLRVAAILTAISAVPATEAAPPSGLPLTLGLQEAAQLLGISPGTLRHRASKPPYQDLRVNNGTRRLRFSSARIVEYMHRGAAHPRRSGPRIGRRP